MLAQTRGDWELIVVDNGNSDEMARIVSNYTSDPRITLIRQENKGIGGGSAQRPTSPSGDTSALCTAMMHWSQTTASGLAR